MPMDVFTSSIKDLEATPEFCRELATYLAHTFPTVAEALRSALSKRYLPSDQRIHLLAHTTNELLERVIANSVLHVPQRLFIPQTNTGMRPLQGENPEDYALRKSQEILSVIPPAEWKQMAKHAGCSVAAIRHAMWATCFHGAIEERLRT